MRIVDIREISVPLEGNIANALVSFAEHTVSLVAVETDVVRNGRPVTGYAFNSIGRYAQSGILNVRILPRLRAAKPESLLDSSGKYFDPEKILVTCMRNEKPGGHGDRAAAMGAVDLAFWDINAKLNDEPAYRTIARHFGRNLEPRPVSVYAAGGYYYPGRDAASLGEEFKAYRDLGFTQFKMKIGGASLKEDLARVESAIAVCSNAAGLAVDANGRFDLPLALDYAKALAPYGLRWFEEAGDPLDYNLNRRIAEMFDGVLATGENLFSCPDVKNLILFGGMRRARDIFQMDAGLSYGLVEYGRMIALLESHGYDRRFCFPHGGHLLGLHIVAGLDLGGCEAYPGVFQPFGGFGSGARMTSGTVHLSDAPGFGLEEKTELRPLLAKMGGF